MEKRHGSKKKRRVEWKEIRNERGKGGIKYRSRKRRKGGKMYGRKENLKKKRKS